MNAKRQTRLPRSKSVEKIEPQHLKDGMLNILVYGPGEGEAIVIQLPDGQLGVVDGCCEPKRKGMPNGNPVHELLHEIALYRKVSPDELRVNFVAVTHPHEDHYRGVGRLLHHFGGRVDRIWTVLPVTGRYREALPKWLRIQRPDRPFPDEPDLKGLDRLVDEIEKFKDGKNEIGHFGFDKRLHIEGDVEFTAVGPTDYDTDRAIRHLIEYLQNAAENATKNPLDPNITSGALLIRWGNTRVLLAGDLLQGTSQQSGWMKCHERLLNQCPIQVVNVAHHGSEGAHHEELWQKMQSRLAIVTPFKRANKKHPPQKDMLNRLAKNSAVFVTSPLAWQEEVLNDIPGAVGQNATSPVMEQDKNNAVLVSLDKDGIIRQLVLGGKAFRYSKT